jgi:hypothetical protein
MSRQEIFSMASHLPDEPFVRSFLEQIGFSHLEGSPGALIHEDRLLTYWPTYQDDARFNQGYFELQNPRSGISGIPPELQPKTKRQLAVLMAYIAMKRGKEQP